MQNDVGDSHVIWGSQRTGICPRLKVMGMGAKVLEGYETEEP